MAAATSFIIAIDTMTVLKYAGLIVVLLVMAFVVFVASRPAESHYQRTRLISAPAGAIFTKINDFHLWPQWSPFEKLDPNMTKTYDGPPAGVGASFSWSGNSKAGQGRATITDNKPNEFVAIKLEFLKPFAAVCQAKFTLVPQTDGTQVTWSMDGHNNFMSKAFCLFMDMDRMIGKDFEEGLANLDRVCRAESTPGEVQ